MTRGGKRIGAGRKNQYEEKLEVTKRLTKTEDDFINFARIKKINLATLKKTFLIIFAILTFCMPVSALTLNASVEYTVDSARLVAFQDTDLTIPASEFNEFMTDRFYYSSIDFINGKISESVGRKIVPFYDKNKKLSFYGVQYNNSPKKLYYSPKGKLLKYEVNTFKGSYPYKTVAYDTKGQLLNINLVISNNESYLFDKNKNLLGHWINNQFYDANGNKDITRSRF